MSGRSDRVSENRLMFGARDEMEELVTFKILLIGLIMFAPGLLLVFGQKAREQALKYHLVVPQQDALVTIPRSQVGLDLTRLAALVLVVLAAVALAVHADQKRRRRKRAAQMLRDMSE